MSISEQNMVVPSDGKKPVLALFKWDDNYNKWDDNYNVWQFRDKAAFETCDFSQAISLSTTPPYMFTAPSVGTYYFGCQVGLHCFKGQKLQLKIEGPFFCLDVFCVVNQSINQSIARASEE